MPRVRRVLVFLAIGSLLLIGFVTCASPNEQEQVGYHDTNSGQQQTASPSKLTEAAILGRWESPTDQDAYIEFVAFGLWVASDGCSSLTGTWRVDQGQLHAGSNGNRSDAHCDSVDVPHAVMNAQSTLLDAHGNLVFVDQTGTRTALVPSC